MEEVLYSGPGAADNGGYCSNDAEDDKKCDDHALLGVAQLSSFSADFFVLWDLHYLGLQFPARFLRCVDHGVVVVAREGLREMRRGIRSLVPAADKSESPRLLLRYCIIGCKGVVLTLLTPY